MVLSSLFLVAGLAPLWIDPVTLMEFEGSAAGSSNGAPNSGLDREGGRAPLPVVNPVVQRPGTVVATDGFSRTVVEGWDFAELGGQYSVSGPLDDFAVADDAGTLTLPAGGRARAAYLAGVSVHDVDLSFSVVFDRQPDDAPLHAYGLLRLTASGAAYRPKMIITPRGAVYAHAGVVLGGVERSLGRPVRVLGLIGTAGTVLRLRATATDSDPTTIRVRVWKHGDQEPAHWQFTIIDWTGNLQAAGAVGIAGYMGRRETGGPLVLRVDDLLATTTQVQTAR
jgi:hypothetical protein